MKLNKFLAIAGMAAMLGLSANTVMAQGAPGAPGGQRQRGNFDPAQMQERMMDRYKETLEITSDDEWKAMQPLVQKVLQARMGAMQGMARGFMGRPRGGDTQAQAQGNRPRGMFGQEPDAATQALEKAVDAKASKAELKAALVKYNEARKAKQAELEKAQNDLRNVLTARQEALATLNGLL